MARFDLSDAEWALIKPLVAEQAARGGAGERPAGAERHLLCAADGLAVARSAGALWPLHDGL